MVLALLLISLLAMAHSYVFFPIILKHLAKGKSLSNNVFTINDNLPTIYLLMAVHNEEDVLPDKIASIYHTSYPLDKLQVYIGSDASTDGTNAILENCKGRYSNFFPMLFRERMGKIRIINTLCKAILHETHEAVFVMTDANVLLEKDTLFHLVKHFRNRQIGLVGANVKSPSERFEGIAYQETSYVNRENSIKYQEGLIWGCMMGAFGACYAMRANLFTAVPENYKVDDFFITLSVLEQGKLAIAETNAICYEDVSTEAKEEFRRKVRIATGNFQNLGRFAKLLWPINTPVAFCFLSHKVLRWLGPLFIIAAFFSNLWLAQGNIFFCLTFIVQCLLLLIPLADFLLKRIGVQIVAVRFVAYFYYMNLALLAGFFKYLKGENNNVWQPTKRNQ